MRAVLIVAAIVAVGFLAFRGCFGGWTTSWNQRLTLVIETPEGEVRGSAVTGVRVVEYSGPLTLPEARGPRATVTGEGVAVEVVPGRWLFALLDGADRKHSSAKSWVYAAYPRDGQGSGGAGLRTHDMVMRAVRSQPRDTPVELPEQSWPMLVTFDDITKPETVREVEPEHLAAVFGEGVRLKAVTLEITREAVTEERVEGVLPWLEKVGREQANLVGRPPSGLVSDLPDPGIYMITPLQFSTELFK